MKHEDITFMPEYKHEKGFFVDFGGTVVKFGETVHDYDEVMISLKKMRHHVMDNHVPHDIVLKTKKFS